MAYIIEKPHGMADFGEARAVRAPARTTPRPKSPERLRTALYGAPLILLFLALWEVAPRLGWLSPVFFPPLSQVAAAWLALVQDGTLWANLSVSLERAMLGFLLAAVVAIPLGFVMGRYAVFEKIVDPLVETLRNTSQFALLPVFVLLFGIGEESKVAITFYSSIFFLLINTVSGVKSVDPLLIKAARAMGTNDLDLFRKVILPACIPSIVSGARLAVKSSIFAVIGAEMLAAKSGIGFLIQQSELMLQTANMYAGIITLTVAGLVINYLLVWFERRATSWKAPRDSNGF